MKKIALATTVLLSLAVTALTSSFAAGSERYSTTIGGEEYTNCNDRELRGPTVTAEDKQTHASAPVTRLAPSFSAS